jgi:hypothetical protein
MTPSGRANRMEMGIVQLSYRAARTRKMARMENVYNSPVWAWPMRSWYDRPVQS